MAELPDRIPGEIIFASYSNQIRDRAVMRYVDQTARDVSVPLPNSGDLAWLTSTNTLTIYDGTQWVVVSTGAGGLTPGVILDSQVAESTTTPTTGTLLAETILTIPSVQEVIVEARGMIRCAAVDENESIAGHILIDEVQDLGDSKIGIGTVSQGGHTHSTQGSTVTGTASSHQHTIAVGSHNHGSVSPSISVADAVKTVSPDGYRRFTPSLVNISVKLIGTVVGSPTGYQNHLISKVWVP